MENVTNNSELNIERPIITDGVVICDKGLSVSVTRVDDKNNIYGSYNDTETGTIEKCKYNYANNTWIYGYKNIQKDNLVNFKDMSEEKKKEVSLQGVTVREQRRQEKKTFNELAKAMLEQTVSEKQIQAVLGDNTSVLLDNSVASVILASMINGAVNGSFKCAEFVRDTAGYKPKNEVEIQADVMTDSDRALIDKLSKRIG